LSDFANKQNVNNADEKNFVGCKIFGLTYPQKAQKSMTKKKKTVMILQYLFEYRQSRVKTPLCFSTDVLASMSYDFEMFFN
jgi:hypothetical protein